MLRFILLLIGFSCLTSQYSFAGYVIAGAKDDELKMLAEHISNYYARTAPQGWEIDATKTEYFSSYNSRTPPQIEEDMWHENQGIDAKIVILVRRLPDNEIKVEIENSYKQQRYMGYDRHRCGKTIFFRKSEEADRAR